MTNTARDEREYAEQAALTLERLGMSRPSGRLLGWLLICDPSAQTMGDLVTALGMSKGAVSTAIRVLVTVGLVERRAVPGARADVYEMRPDAFLRASQMGEQMALWQDLMQRGLDIVGDQDSPRAARLRTTRDFYAFLGDQLPGLLERYQRERR
jgi:DNA-binding transcriptional regulator GbsR (MarR family)